MAATLPRRFHLQRHHDVTGASGTGRVADGVLWPDGTASVRWRGERPSTVTWDRVDDALAIHGHGGHTEIVWDDPEPPITDPRQVGGGIVGPGGPRDRHGVIIDTDQAVLLDESHVAQIETGSQGVALAMQLSGRINQTRDRASVLYLLNGDGAAAIISELVALASRIGPEFSAALHDRLARLADDGATGTDTPTP